MKRLPLIGKQEIQIFCILLQIKLNQCKTTDEIFQTQDLKCNCSVALEEGILLWVILLNPSKQGFGSSTNVFQQSVSPVFPKKRSHSIDIANRAPPLVRRQWDMLFWADVWEDLGMWDTANHLSHQGQLVPGLKSNWDLVTQEASQGGEWLYPSTNIQYLCPTTSGNPWLGSKRQ